MDPVGETARNLVTTGNGCGRLTALARPGDGPGVSGDVSQFAGSCDPHVLEMRSRDRPRYWWLSSLMPVQSASAPREFAAMGHGAED
jgi:hypothetical protein